MRRASTNFSAHPLFWLFLSLAAGVACSRLAALAWPWALAVGLGCAGAAAVSCRRSAKAAMLLLAFAGAGATLEGLERRSEANANRVRNLYQAGLVPDGAPVELAGVIDAAPELAPDGWYLLLRVESLRFRETEHATGGYVALFAPMRDAEQRAAYAALVLRYGARLRVATRLEYAEHYRNPGVAPRSEFLEQRGYDAFATVKSPLLVERLPDAPARTGRALLYDWRQSLAEKFARTFDTETSGVLQAALLGWRHSLSKSAAERFRAGGTFHVLVISGLHITFLGFCARWLAQRFTRRRDAQFALTAAFVWAYALLAGAEASVVRAALMFTVATLAPVLHRRANTLNSLGGAGLALLVWRPADVFDPSFQLTFLSVFAIVALAWPVWVKLEAMGRWHPAYETPAPPPAGWPRKLGELLCWSEKQWQREQARAAFGCRLWKTPWAARLENWRVQWLLRWVAGAVWVSACVQVVMLPLAVLYFHRVSWASLVLNIFVGALMAALSGVALVALLLAQAGATVAAPLVKLAQAINWLMTRSGDPFGVASWRVAEYTGWQAAIYGLYFAPVCVLAAWAWRWNPFALEYQISDTRYQKMAAWSLAALGLLFAVIVWHPFSARADGRLRVCFLDVGQGDATLLVMPDGATALVDGGGKISFARQNDDGEEVFERDTRGVGEAVVSEYLWQRGLGRIDYILATHADTDHIEGLNDVARNFTVRAALAGHAPPEDAEFAAFTRTLRERNVPLKIIGRGETLRFGEVVIETLWPLPANDANAPSANNDSVVWRVRYGNRAFLLTGDIEKEAEAALTQQPETLRADVVKVPHHGSRTSSTQAFINATRPAYAVASVGLNSRFGHPHQEVVERWQAGGAQFWTTGQKGLIDFSTDGRDLQVETFVSQKQNQ
jgi:competence protein ComEC